MSYDERETSIHDGEPVECYQFSRGGLEWLLTSADRAVTLPTIGVFEPDAIIAGGQELREEDQNGGVEIRLPRTSPIVEPYISYPPGEKAMVRIYRAHRGEESDANCIFFGWIASVPFSRDGSIATAQCVSLLGGLEQRVPGMAYTGQCNRRLYGPGCDVIAANFRDTIGVTGANGSTLSSPHFALRPSGWYTAGWIERDNGERRMVVAHVGDTVTLMSRFSALGGLELVSAYAGCDLTRACCFSRFNNAVNFFGFEWMPWRDPHTKRVG